MKRILWVADMHCGHFAGLTHPDFERKPKRDYSNPLYQQWVIRRKCWKFFYDIVSIEGPFDVAIVLGDDIDGRGEKSGGTELLTPDRSVQTDMAAANILTIGAPEVYGVYGTPYHAGVQEDWEDEVARKAGFVRIEDVGRLNVNGKILRYRHHVGGSNIPHGRFTPLAKEHIWNLFWAERKEDVKADMLVFGHRHYHVMCSEPGKWEAWVAPALQAYGTKFGGRKMSGTVDFGLMWTEIDDNGTIRTFSRTMQFPFTEKVQKV